MVAEAVHAGDDRRDRHGPATANVVSDLVEIRERGMADRLDEYVDDAATGKTDGERVVVADAVALQDRLRTITHPSGELEDGALDAAAGHAADGSSVGADEHRGSRLAGRGLPRLHDRAQADDAPGRPPGQELIDHITHARSRRPAAAGRRSCVRRRGERCVAARRAFRQ